MRVVDGSVLPWLVTTTHLALNQGRGLKGIPSGSVVPDLVPAVGNEGEAGWVGYELLTYGAHPRLTADGVQQTPIPLYDSVGAGLVDPKILPQAGSRPAQPDLTPAGPRRRSSPGRGPDGRGSCRPAPPRSIR